MSDHIDLIDKKVLSRIEFYDLGYKILNTAGYTTYLLLNKIQQEKARQDLSFLTKQTVLLLHKAISDEGQKFDQMIARAKFQDI